MRALTSAAVTPNMRARFSGDSRALVCSNFNNSSIIHLGREGRTYNLPREMVESKRCDEMHSSRSDPSTVERSGAADLRSSHLESVGGKALFVQRLSVFKVACQV